MTGMDVAETHDDGSVTLHCGCTLSARDVETQRVLDAGGTPPGWEPRREGREAP